MAKRWIRRSDGVIQRYNVKSISNYRQTGDKSPTGANVWTKFEAPKEEIQKRLLPTVEKERLSVAINFPVHGEYWGVLGQLWRSKITPSDEAFIARKSQEILLNFLNYDIGELWFDIESVTFMQGDGIQEVSTTLSEGYWEVRIEDETGATEFKDEGIF